MRKGLVIILAVAIIGALGVYSKAQKTSANSTTQNTTSSTTSEPAAINTSTSSQTAIGSVNPSASTYKDGTYTGDKVSTIYGDVEVATVVSGGKIVEVKFLKMPSDEGRSREVTAFSESPLKQSTLSKQSAHVDFVSGATQTSEGYERSLQSALNQAV